ncbi:MAG: purine-binding chemotaxis protein CheW [Coriobacteriia bacterium]|nr:purine-binding chemotaxis protein CheW [Coriobacteriia bacterium]
MSGDPALGSALDAAALEELKRRALSLAQEAEEEHGEESLTLLLFELGEECYAVRVTEVREIYQEYSLTPIPCVPDHVLGVVNIRGEIVSVTDLARLMKLPSGGSTECLPAIVLQGESAVTAAVVDAIGDIVEVPKDALEPPVSIVGKVHADYISGSVYVDDRLVGLVNLERVLQPVGAAD